MSSATLQHIIQRRKHHQGATIEQLPAFASMQLNDGHPVVIVADRLRILTDKEHLSFSQAYDICTSVFSYTCHMLMPEGLEKWAIALVEKVIPRQPQVIDHLNQQLVEKLRYQYHATEEVIQDPSIIEECSEDGSPGESGRDRLAHNQQGLCDPFRVHEVIHLSQLQRNLVAEVPELNKWRHDQTLAPPVRPGALCVGHPSGGE
jgi:hypothetical protein